MIVDHATDSKKDIGRERGVNTSGVKDKFLSSLVDLACNMTARRNIILSHDRIGFTYTIVTIIHRFFKERYYRFPIM